MNSRRNPGGRIWEVALTSLLILLVVIPVVGALVVSFLGARLEELSGVFFLLLARSLVFASTQALLSASIATALGVVLGLWLSFFSGPRERVLLRFIEAAGFFCFILPGVAVSLLVIDLHRRLGFPAATGLWAIVAAHVFLNSLFVAASVSRRCRSWWLSGGREIFEAMAMLGAPPYRRLQAFVPVLKVEIRFWFPLIFFWSMTAFATVLILGGSPLASSPELMLFYSLQSDPGSGRIMVLFLFQLLCGWVLARWIFRFQGAKLFQGEERQKPTLAFRSRVVLPSGLNLLGVLILGALGLPVFWLVLAPLFEVLSQGASSLISQNGMDALLNSLALCFMAAACALVFSIGLIRVRSVFRRRVAWGMGVSGALLMLGWVILGWDLWLEGHPFLQLIAEALGVCLLLLPFMALWLDARLSSVSPEIYEAAEVLGARNSHLFRRVDWPLCQDLVGKILLYSAMAALGELALSSFLLKDVETLSLLSRRMATRYDFSGSAWVLMSMVVLTLMGLSAENILLWIQRRNSRVGER